MRCGGYAVEWQLYFAFPLFLLVRRLIGPAKTVGAGLVGIWAVDVVAHNAAPLHRLLDLSPQFAALFIFGMVAAEAATRTRPSRVPWGWITTLAFAASAVVCAVLGSVRVLGLNLYWSDLVVGAMAAALLAALSGEDAGPVKRFLQHRHLAGAGRFSYSIYLIHAPILAVGWLYVVQPLGWSENASFALMIFAVAPVAIVASYGFYLAVERPAMNRRAQIDRRSARRVSCWRPSPPAGQIGAGQRARNVDLLASREARALDIHFFKNPRFSAASGAISLTFFALYGTIFLLTQYLQSVLGYSTVEAGAVLLPQAATLMIAAPLSALWVQKIGNKLVVGTGLVLVSISLFLFLGLTPTSSVWAIIGVTIVMGLGMGNVMAPATDSIMGSLPRSKAGVGSAMNDTTRQVGGAVGVAVLGSILTSRYSSQILTELGGKVPPALAALDQRQREPRRGGGQVRCPRPSPTKPRSCPRPTPAS